MVFLDQIQTRVLLFDGAASTWLHEKGLVPKGECPELLSITRPMDVLDIHMSYLDAGADIITANTFGANDLRLAQFDLSGRADELVQSAVALCKECVTDRDAFVAAPIGPTGELVQSDPAMPGLIYESFFKQCSAAASAGADIIIIETMNDLAEARLALLAAHASTTLPVLCSFILEEDEHTYAGNPPEVLALCAKKLNAALCGVNCGYGPDELFSGYSRLAGAGALHTFALPNARRKDGSRLSPADMAEAMRHYLHAGVAALGCCCAPDAEYVRALRAVVEPFHGHARHIKQMWEYICSATKITPLSALEQDYKVVTLQGRAPQDAIDELVTLSSEQDILHIDVGDCSGEDIRAFVFMAMPHIHSAPLAFHVYAARQANAALFAYPGIAAVYAQSDAYKVLKAAARYGAEVIT